MTIGSRISRSRESRPPSPRLRISGLRQRVLAALAKAGPCWISGCRFDVSPAAVAFHSACALDRDTRIAAFPQLDVRNDKQHRQIVLFELLQDLAGFRNDHLRLERAADLFVFAERLNLGQHTFP